MKTNLNSGKMLLLLTGACISLMQAKSEAAYVVLKPVAGPNLNGPGLPDQPNISVYNDVYDEDEEVLTWNDTQFALSITMFDDQNNQIAFTGSSITTLNRTISTNISAATFTWSGALFAMDSAAAPVARAYNQIGTDVTVSEGLQNQQVIGLTLNNVWEVVISGAAILPTTLSGAYNLQNPGDDHSMQWTVDTSTTPSVISALSTVTLVPEPSTTLLGIVGSICAFRRKRNAAV